MWKDAFKRNPKLALALLPLILGVVGLQGSIDPLRRQPAIEPPSARNILTGTRGGQLPGEFILGAFTGFRQVIAGLLWVRADSFFHQGNYDAILPLVRLITWLDPNWLDVYATGGWHMMYNFTDTDNRSDRRYLVPGLALLNEGIRNNPTVYDLYKEKGWNNFDKVKDFATSADAYRGALKNDAKANTTQVLHALGHALERAGDIEGSLQAWKSARERHLKEAKESKEAFSGGEQGARSAERNISMMTVRQAVRPRDTSPPVDADMHFKIRRLGPKRLEVSGTFNLIGTRSGPYFDAGTFDKRGIQVEKIGKGILSDGPRDGGRLEIRLQDAGYKMELPTTFDLQVDPKVTLMQEMTSIKGGRMARRGEPYAIIQGTTESPDQRLLDAGLYSFSKAEATAIKGVPAAQAIASGAVSPMGKRVLVNVSYPKRSNVGPVYTDAEVEQLFTRLKGDSFKISELTKQHVFIAQNDHLLPGKFKREIDMSKDPLMYGFASDSGKYEMILWFNPRTAPDFIQDRIGWNGEGLSDKKYLVETTEPYPWIEYKDIDAKPVRMIRVTIPLTREQITGKGEATLFEG